MYQSTSYASRGRKTAFVQMAERSAETARLLQQARGTQPAPPPERARSLARRVLSRRDRLLQGLGERRAQARS